MAKHTRVPTDIDAYIAGFPTDVQQRLQQMRRTIHQAAPYAQETISYRMPAFTQDGTLVWFGAYKHHIGLYPGASAIAVFQQELSVYKSAKGSVQFPFDHPLPLALVRRIVQFRMSQQRVRTQKTKER